jgi:hypothetical protein
VPERSAETDADLTAAAGTRALQSVVAAPAVFFVPTAEDSSGLTANHVAGPEICPATIAMLEALIHDWLARSSESDGEEYGVVGNLAWQMVMAETRTSSGTRSGALAIARPAREPFRWSSSEILTLRAFAGLYGSQVEAEGGDSAVPAQRGLDALVTRIAVELMSVSAPSLDEAQEWMLRVLSEFFEVDASFLRRNDLDREMTVLVAEWPRRQNVPDPDPLGVVPFGVDPVFDLTRDLKEPFVMRPSNSGDAYQERVEQASGIGEVSIAVVPLIRNDATVGVLGFVKFGDRPWDTKETNALQAAASLMVQLQARIEAEEHSNTRHTMMSSRTYPTGGHS